MHLDFCILKPQPVDDHYDTLFVEVIIVFFSQIFGHFCRQAGKCNIYAFLNTLISRLANRMISISLLHQCSLQIILLVKYRVCSLSFWQKVYEQSF